MGELCKIDYGRNLTYTFEDQNAVGATTSTTLRTLETISGSTYYVKKWGTDYAIGDITNAVIANPRSDGGGVNQWTFEFFGWNGTAWVSMGSVQDSTGASQAFSDGSAFAATKIKIVITCDSGVVTITDGDTINLTTDVDAPLVVNLSGEGNTYTFNAAWGTLTLYLSASGSTYYDEDYMYGGKRHTPVVGSTKYPFFHPDGAFADGGWGANDGQVIQDSESYQVSERAITNAGVVIQSALGQTLNFVSPISSSEFRDVSHDGNNDDTVYASTSGNDGTGDGTYQNPYLTHSNSFTNRGTRTHINTKDSGTYNESFTMSANVTIEPIYGQTPQISTTTVITSYFDLTSAGVNVYGYTFQPSSNVTYPIHFSVGGGTSYSGTIKNNSIGINTFHGILINCLNFTGEISNNEISGALISGIRLTIAGAASNGTIKNNTLYENGTGISISPNGGGTNFTGNVYNNLSYNNTNIGMETTTASFTGVIQNNTFYNNPLYGFGTTVNTTNLRNNIGWDNGTDFYSTVAVTMTYTNYSTKNANVTAGAGSITTDPKFIKETTPYRLGIKSTSGAYHTDSVNNNMGIYTHMFNVQANNVKFNGIIFDCLHDYCHSVIISTNTDYTDPTIKWCATKNSTGILIDMYDNGTNIGAIIQNVEMLDGGQGCAIAHGNNTIEQCIFKNYSIDLWLDQAVQTIDHCVFYGSNYGLYFDSNIVSPVITNSIFNENSLYGIFSNVSVRATYCCVTSAVNENVDISDSSNIIDKPLFVNESADDFHIKTIERGFSVNSPCKLVSNDSPAKDIGAFDVDYDTSTDDWETYTLEYNPRNLNDLLEPKGVSDFQDALGERDSWAKSHRVVLPMEWSSDSATDESQYKTLRSFTYRIQTRDNELTAEQCKFRVYLLPESKYGSGTGTIDATAKTLTDSTKSWYDYEKNEWYVAVVYETQAGAAVDGTLKTVTKAGAGWTVDEWEGYYVFQNNNYFFIKSNTATVLTVSDGNDNLVTDASFDLNIVKLFHIKSNVGNVLTLTDDDNELVDGSYSYWIHFVLCRIVPGSFQASQDVFDFEKWNTKSAYTITYESIRE